MGPQKSSAAHGPSNRVHVGAAIQDVGLDVASASSNFMGMTCCFSVELPGIETDALPGNMPSELQVHSVSFQFSPARYLRFHSQVLTASRGSSPMPSRSGAPQLSEMVSHRRIRLWTRSSTPPTSDPSLPVTSDGPDITGPAAATVVLALVPASTYSPMA